MSWILLAEVGILAASYVISWLMAPDVLKAQPKDQLLNIPTTVEGAPQPYVYGRIRIRQPVLAWWGNFTYYQFADFPMRYGCDLLFDLGIPMPPTFDASAEAFNANLVAGWRLHKLMKIYIDDKPYPVFQTNNFGDSVFDANENELPRNGVTGYGLTMLQTPGGYGDDGYGFGIEFWDGHESPSPGLGVQQDVVHTPGGMGNGLTQAAIAMKRAFYDLTQIPGYGQRMMVGIYAAPQEFISIYDPVGNPTGTSTPYFFNLANNPNTGWSDYGFGTSASIPNLHFEVMCVGPNDGLQLASGDASPIDVILDLMTSTGWGKLGIPAGNIDLVSFSTAKATLFAEGNGYSRFMNEFRTAKEWIAEIVQQIGAVFFIDQSTSQYKIKLLRADYITDPSNPAAVPLYDQVDIEAIEDFSTGTWLDCIGRVQVTFTDRVTQYEQGMVVVQNLANAAGQEGGHPKTKTIDYPGCTERGAAGHLARRDLAVLGKPFLKCKMITNRRGAQLKPGDVIRMTHLDFGITEMAMRVVEIDLGTYLDGKVSVSLIRDVFADVVSSTAPQVFTFFIPQPLPLVTRTLTETPYFLALQAYNSGVIPNLTQTHLWWNAYPLFDPEGFGTDTFLGMNLPLVALISPSPGLVDVPSHIYPLRAKVSTAVTRENAPYATSTGVVITTPSGPFQTAATVGQIASGTNTILVGDEIMAYETATDNGDGTWTLHNVWRELMDTKADAWPIGTPVYWIDLPSVGLRGWGINKSVWCQFIPKLNGLAGSGDDVTQHIVTRGRVNLPARGADFGLDGEDMVGTLGTPAGTPVTNLTGHYKKVTKFEGGFTPFWRKRDRTKITVTRGDSAVAETPPDAGTTYSILAGPAGAATTVLVSGLTDQDPTKTYVMGTIGHGNLEIALQTNTTAGLNSWANPTITVRAERWRNLVANPRFIINSGSLSNWSSFTATVATTTNGITKAAAADYYAIASGPSTPPAWIEQDIVIDGYLPRGMSVWLECYMRNLNGDVDDSLTLLMNLYDKNLTLLGATFATSTTVAPTAVWTPIDLNGGRTIDASTYLIRLRATFIDNVGASADTAITEIRVRIGQFNNGATLANPSFETGTTGSWTVNSGAFIVSTAIQSPSANYLQGGASANSQIQQEYTLLTGWEVGTTVLLEFWRAQTLVNDTGKVTLQAVDGGAAIVATTDTTVENLTTLNVWNRRSLSLDIPDGTVKVRVLFDAVRTAGAGNSGACVDEFRLSIHKDLTPRVVTTLLTNMPSVQPILGDWESWVQAHPTIVEAGVAQPVVIANGNVGASSRHASSYSPQLQWSDGTTRLGGELVAQWGGGVASRQAFRFTRQSGASVPDLQVWAQATTSQLAHTMTTGKLTVIVLFRVDEAVFANACGLAGRMDGNGGWALDIDATGFVKSFVKGSISDKIAVRTGLTVTDGALHMAAFTYSGAANRVRAYDERGFTETSTVGMGEIGNGSGVLRIGRSRDSIDTIPGLIAEVLIFDGYELTSAQVAAHWNYAKDPNGLVTTYSRASTCVVPGMYDTNGATLCTMATDQIAFGYEPHLADFADSLIGLSMGIATSVAPGTNVISSFDFTNPAAWVLDVGAAVVNGLRDPTGGLVGMRLGATTVNGISHVTNPIGASANQMFVVWMRDHGVGTVVKVELRNSAGVLKDTKTITLSSSNWAKYQVQFTAWDNSTSTGKLHFIGNVATIDVDICSFMYMAAGTIFPAVYPVGAGGVMAGTTKFVIGQTFPKALNVEGEIIMEGIGLQASPINSVLCTLENLSDKKNQRDMGVSGTAQPQFNHYDAVGPSFVTSTGTAIDWSQKWQLRGRWCYAQMLDNAANAFAGLVTTASVNSAVYGRNATFIYSAVQNVSMTVGPISAYIRRVVVQTREEKLP